LRKEPIRLRDLHVTILMRAYLLGSSRISVARLSDELAGRTSASQISEVLADLVAAELAVVETAGEDRLLSLESNGRRNARMTLDGIGLADPDLLRPTTSAAKLLGFFDRSAQGLVEKPARWRYSVLQWKWLFRRNWDSLES
jgi:hypothetical protein